MAEQMGHRGFAVRACDADPGDGLQRVPGHGHLSVNGHTVAAQMLKGWVVPGDAWTYHDPLQIIQPGIEARDLQRNAQMHLHSLLLKEVGSLVQSLACSGIDHGDGSAGLSQETSGSHA